MAYASNPSYSGGGGGGRRTSSLRSVQAKVKRLSQKTKFKKKRAGGLVQVVEHLPSILKTLVLDLGGRYTVSTV
jgi:hypothetical protein